MAATLIVLNATNTFAAVGPDSLVLGHLSHEPRRRWPFPPIVVGPLQRAVAMVASQPTTPHDASQLEAFDTLGRKVPLTMTDGSLHASAATGPADPAAVLTRLRAVITHLNTEATRSNPKRTRRDQEIVDSALESGLLPLGLPTTLVGAAARLYSSGYADSPAAVALALAGRAIRRTPLRSTLAHVPTDITGDLGPIGDGRPPPIIIPHQAGWFHNLWHAVTGTR